MNFVAEQPWQTSLMGEGSSLQHMWRVALRRNQYDVINDLIDTHGISPSMYVAPYARHPITYIIDKGQIDDPHALILIKSLARHGTELNVKDSKGAVPADYALLSDNREVALAVFSETIRHGWEKSLKYPYVPGFMGLLKICTEEDVRIEKAQNLCRNVNFIAETFWNDLYHANPEISEVANRGLKALEVIPELTLSNLIEDLVPSYSLVMAIEEYQRMKSSTASPNSFLDMAKQNKVVCMEEWRAIREI